MRGVYWMFERGMKCLWLEVKRESGFPCSHAEITDQGVSLGLIINCFRTKTPVPYAQPYISHSFFS